MIFHSFRCSCLCFYLGATIAVFCRFFSAVVTFIAPVFAFVAEVVRCLHFTTIFLNVIIAYFPAFLLSLTIVAMLVMINSGGGNEDIDDDDDADADSATYDDDVDDDADADAATAVPAAHDND